MNTPLPEYAELHCLSNFSFLRGASHPQELAVQAAALDYRALALTDECSLAGVVRAHLAAKSAGLKLILGSEFKLVDGTKLVLLAENRAGYGRLCEIITYGRRVARKGHYRLCRRDLEGDHQHLLCLWIPGDTPDAGTGHWIQAAWPGRTWIAAELLLGGNDRQRLSNLCALGRDLGLPLVAAGDVHMHVRARRRLQDVLTAIRLGKSLAEIPLELYPNGERHLRSRARLAHIYPPELLQETLAIAARCRFSLDELRYEYPEEIVPPGITPTAYLRTLVQAGAVRRWPTGAPAKAQTQIEHEFALIAELGYEPYFLTVYDLVKFARARNILCQGRGSAANSAVCYCLGITELDPARMDLLFERFMSHERQEPPDIDVDFEHQRREEVIQYLYAKYGRERAALTAALITYRPRSAVRDVGKALGLERTQIARLAAAFRWWDREDTGAQPVREAGLDPGNPLLQQLVELAGLLLGFPRHLSQHTGGFVIARGLLCRLVPIENAAMPARTVIEWDKNDLDALGLLKVDVLALGMLSALHRALALVGRRHNRLLTLADIPAEDSEVYRMIQQADTVGVFQIESRAQMVMLPKLKPASFYDLVIEIALIRPGPIQGDMVHPYLARRWGREPVVYPSAAVQAVLERTLGVPVFQEQVMRLAVVAAGFTAGEADQLRRAMAAWRRTGDLGPFEHKLVTGMRARGYSEKFAQQIYHQIKGFGEYGFPESHSASFALLAYTSAWLKRHEPAAFLCALLNSQPMGFYAPAQLIQDARRHGVAVRPVDVNRSACECTLEEETTPQPAVRIGLALVSGLAESTAKNIFAARMAGTFVNLDDLVRRTGLDRGALKCLAASGALAALAGQRHLSYWAALGVETPWALGRASIPEARPLLTAPSEGENIIADYASLGFTLGRHPLALLRPWFEQHRLLPAAGVLALPNRARVQVAGLVTHRQRPGSANGVTFVTLEDETGHVNVIVWPDLGERERTILVGSRLLGITGTVQRDGEVIQVLATDLQDLSRQLGGLEYASRDFH
ncbi:MAG: error-prone DNA polymerase [Gammaproteobacteria bacterium]